MIKIEMINSHKPRDHCGVFGVFAPKEDVARLTFYGLLSLQHRGQESAGIASSNFKRIKVYKQMGLVNQIFTEKEITELKGKLAIGHTRYSTAGKSNLKNAQPIILSSENGEFSMVHNGNLVNYKILKKELLQKGHCLTTDSDPEIIARLIAQTKGNTFKQKLVNGIPKLKGAFSLIFLTKNKLFLVRDKWGIRPLVLGKINSQGWVAASESTAIESIGGKVIRQVKPGEVIEISKKGVDSFYRFKSKNQGFCIFEYVYFSRPDSIINERLVHQTRIRAGRLLAKQKPTKADFVISVPDSGTSSALGFSQESKIPFQEGLIKSKYIGRTFIQPTQRIRDLGVRLKFSPLGQVIKGKNIVLVDDSIVRGTTITKIIEMLKEKGANKIHLRIASPPFKYTCFLGVDVSRTKDLIANQNNAAQIKKMVKADSLVYLSLENLIKAVGIKQSIFCTGCFDRNYPLLPTLKN